MDVDPVEQSGEYSKLHAHHQLSCTLVHLKFRSQEEDL